MADRRRSAADLPEGTTICGNESPISAQLLAVGLALGGRCIKALEGTLDAGKVPPLLTAQHRAPAYVAPRRAPDRVRVQVHATRICAHDAALKICWPPRM